MQIFLHTPHPLLNLLLSTTTMPKSSKEIEDRIQNAVNAYKHAENPKITNIAREFQVPYASLRRRVQGVPSRLQQKPVNYTLNKHQEMALQNWIHQLDKSGCPPTAQQVEKCANSFLERSHSDPQTPPPKVGQNWAYWFIQRLPPEYKLQKQKPIDPKRMNAEDIGVVEHWYDLFHTAIHRHQIQPGDIYNFDEIGFLEGQGREEKVVTQFPERHGSISSSFSWSLITVLECICADGSIIPPLIVPPGKGHIEDWYTHSNLPLNWAIYPSPNGFTSDEIAFAWIQHFHKHSQTRQVSIYLYIHPFSNRKQLII